jgi:hypothetical protein
MALRARTTIAVLGALATLAVSACGGDPAPATNLPATASSTASTTTSLPTTTATTTPPDVVLARIPLAARPNTREGAEAFGRFFIAQVSGMFVNADPALLEGLSSAACKACLGYVDGAAKLAKDGLHHKAPRLTVKRSSANSMSETGAVVAVQVIENAVDVLDKSGVRVRVTDGGDTGTLVLTMAWRGQWVVDRLQLEKL